MARTFITPGVRVPNPFGAGNRLVPKYVYGSESLRGSARAHLRGELFVVDVTDESDKGALDELAAQPDVIELNGKVDTPDASKVALVRQLLAGYGLDIASERTEAELRSSIVSAMRAEQARAVRGR